MIFEKASKLELIERFSRLSTAQIIRSRYPSIAELRMQYGNEKTTKLAMVLVHDLNHSFSGEMDENQIEEIGAELCGSLLKNVSLEDVYLAFRNLKIADVYGKLTVNKCLKALEKQLKERTDQIAEKNYNEHLANKFVDNEPIDLTKKMAEEKKAKTWYEMNKEEVRKEREEWKERIRKEDEE